MLQQSFQPVHRCMDLDSGRDTRLGTGLSGKWIDFSFFVDTLSSTNGFATALLGTSCKGYDGRLGFGNDMKVSM